MSSDDFRADEPLTPFFGRVNSRLRYRRVTDGALAMDLMQCSRFVRFRRREDGELMRVSADYFLKHYKVEQ